MTPMTVTEQTYSEIKLKHAILTEKASRLRARSAVTLAMSRKASSLAREIRQTQQLTDSTSSPT